MKVPVAAFPHPTSLFQAPREQGPATARETPDQQRGQEKETHRGEENSFSSSFCFLFVKYLNLSFNENKHTGQSFLFGCKKLIAYMSRLSFRLTSSAFRNASSSSNKPTGLRWVKNKAVGGRLLYSLPSWAQVTESPQGGCLPWCSVTVLFPCSKVHPWNLISTEL